VSLGGDVESGPFEDGELVERARLGDVRAYEVLVRRYQGQAQRVAYLVTGVGADAEDVAQEAFVKAWYGLKGFRADAPFRPWLLRIVANEASNRRAWTRRRFALPLETVVEQGALAGGASAEESALDAVGRQQLADAVAALPRRDRLVISCRYFLELSEAETADVLGTRRGTVKSRLSRALGRLRTAMAADSDADFVAGWRES
jgi:RNA polymerase sigma-70 factor (ECF subfamily)